MSLTNMNLTQLTKFCFNAGSQTVVRTAKLLSVCYRFAKDACAIFVDNNNYGYAVCDDKDPEFCSPSSLDKQMKLFKADSSYNLTNTIGMASLRDSRKLVFLDVEKLNNISGLKDVEVSEGNSTDILDMSYRVVSNGTHLFMFRDKNGYESDPDWSECPNEPGNFPYDSGNFPDEPGSVNWKIIVPTIVGVSLVTIAGVRCLHNLYNKKSLLKYLDSLPEKELHNYVKHRIGKLKAKTSEQAEAFSKLVNNPKLAKNHIISLHKSDSKIKKDMQTFFTTVGNEESSNADVNISSEDSVSALSSVVSHTPVGNEESSNADVVIAGEGSASSSV